MAQTPSAPYVMTHGPHGLGLAFHRMPHALSVAVGIWVQAGGRYESAESAGISHFLEHLLFKGTRRRSCEALKQHIEGIGGSLNGFTAEEFTCYMAKVPRQYARRAIDVLADMVCSPTLKPGDVVFIGDSCSDYQAVEGTGVVFIGRRGADQFANAPFAVGRDMYEVRRIIDQKDQG